jgi:hypothetical protein
MFKIPDTVLAQLRAGTASALTPDEAKEVARYIDTLGALDQVPALLKKMRDEVRLQRRDQRARS